MTLLNKKSYPLTKKIPTHKIDIFLFLQYIQGHHDISIQEILTPNPKTLL